MLIHHLFLNHLFFVFCVFPVICWLFLFLLVFPFQGGWNNNPNARKVRGIFRQLTVVGLANNCQCVDWILFSSISEPVDFFSSGYLIFMLYLLSYRNQQQQIILKYRNLLPPWQCDRVLRIDFTAYKSRIGSISITGLTSQEASVGHFWQTGILQDAP